MAARIAAAAGRLRRFEEAGFGAGTGTPEDTPKDGGLP